MLLPMHYRLQEGFLLVLRLGLYKLILLRFIVLIYLHFCGFYFEVVINVFIQILQVGYKSCLLIAELL